MPIKMVKLIEPSKESRGQLPKVGKLDLLNQSSNQGNGSIPNFTVGRLLANAEMPAANHAAPLIGKLNLNAI